MSWHTVILILTIFFGFQAYCEWKVKRDQQKREQAKERFIAQTRYQFPPCQSMSLCDIEDRSAGA